MSSMRILAATLAAIAVLALPEAAAQPAASDDNADPSAPRQPPSITFVVPRPAVVETLVEVAESGNVDAMNLLGVLYTTGTQVPRDTSMALYWFQKAIDGGSADAMDNLASIYSVAVMAEKGLGTSRNVQLARAMYRRAAESGFTPAMVRVSEHCAGGSGGKRDLVEAYAWLQVASQSGLPEELQIAALASMAELEARLAPERRDDARERATRIIALVKTRTLPAERKAPTAMHFSSL